MEYLAIKNWEKYQPNRGASSWVKDWTDKESDAGYMKLTGFQRYILDGCRRLRGKFGRNLCNDPEYIARALQVIPKERHCVPQAIRVLTARGFLVVCNHELESSLHIDKEEEKREEKSKKEEKSIPPSAEAKPKFTLPDWVNRGAWDDYEQMRRRIGKPMTDRARELAVDKLAALQNKGHPVDEVLRQSVFNSWQGLFELKLNGHKSKMQEQFDVIDKVEF